VALLGEAAAAAAATERGGDGTENVTHLMESKPRCDDGLPPREPALPPSSHTAHMLGGYNVSLITMIAYDDDDGDDTVAIRSSVAYSVGL